MALTRVSGGILKQPIDVGIITATSLNASGIITAGTVQVGSATTIHTTGIDLGSGNVTSHNINSTGIITATSFVGPVTGNLTGNVTGNLTGDVTGNLTGNADTASNLTGSPSITVDNITASGNVSIAGTLTYQDVTNIDSVGIITAQAGIHVTGGSVGIGLTNPEKLLEVSSNSSPTIRINNSDGSISADQTIGVIEFKANDGSGDGSQVTGSIESISQAAFTGQGSPSHLIFKTNGVSGADALTERLRVDSSGRLGLGTTDPGSYFSDATELVVADTDHDCGITIASSSSHKGTIAFADGTSGDAAYRGYINYIHSSDSLQLATSGTERLRIISDGKIGIGITNPNRLLQLSQANSTAYSGTDFDQDYHVLKLNNTTDSKTVGMQFLIGSNGEAAITATETSDGATDLIFGTRGSGSRAERLRINSSGQVSIGNNPTVASDAALHIEFDGTREYLRLEGDGGGSNSYLEIEAPNNRRKAIIFKSGGTRRGVIGVGDSDEASATSLFLSASANVAGNDPHMVITSDGKVKISNHGTNNLRSLSVLAPKTQIQWGTAEDVGGFLMSENNGQFGLSGGGYWNGSSWVATHTGSAQIRHDGGGAIVFCTNTSLTSGNNFSPAERLRIDDSGNVNIGAKDYNAHNSTVDSLQIGYALNLYEDSYTSGNDNYLILANNALYAASGGNTYMRNDEAMRIYMHAGQFVYQNAPAGTAGNGITFTSRLLITSGGYVGINTNSASERLEVNGPIRTGSTSFSAQTQGAGLRQYAVCPAGVGYRLAYNIFNGYHAEKSFSHYFPNGVANRALRIHSNRSSFWTCGFITIHSSYSNQNASGMLRYHFRHNANGTSNYGKSIDVDVNLGYTSGNFGMSDNYSFKTWGSNGGSTTSHALEIRHLTSTGNGCYITVELYGANASTYIDDLYMTTGHTY